ncbi:Hypothetical protein FKW44_012585, partial [Caligus rogercresseyi]
SKRMQKRRAINEIENFDKEKISQQERNFKLDQLYRKADLMHRTKNKIESISDLTHSRL